MTTEFPLHVWHDCKIHGHVGGMRDEHGEYSGSGCLSCEGGLGGCVVCGQWEGMIAFAEACIGFNPHDRALPLDRLARVVEYHRREAPVFRPARASDLHPGVFVTFRDEVGQLYPGRVVFRLYESIYKVEILRDGQVTQVEINRVRDDGTVTLGVYDPGHADREW